MKRNRMTTFLVTLVAGIGGGILVLFTCGLGLLIVVPFFALLPAVAYLLATGQKRRDF